ncbi:MarR family transcriptional regulator [Roseiarcaceae bacterium H3SJ34-1]|uniref:MarR family winged helix-turn-helix transcriptional regulator n=1 Tax=Terripilifer ovatus TaxID=3032367 RepID=UPI003AB9AFF9|nr:MarR family transcriptional regulator [Roseiarcaceae bacterium H3SJ34-1]
MSKTSKPTLSVQADPRSERGIAYTDLMFEIFRINNRINAWGDRFSAGTGLTGARWRVLGSTLPEPKQVAQIARERGMTRQSVQQIANSLVDDGFARFKDNARHKSSKLLEPTALGRKTILQLNARYAGFADALSDGSTAAELRATTKLLARLSAQLDDVSS